MRNRIIAASGAVAAVAAATLAAAPGALAQGVSGCQLQGTANFGTPLTGGPGASPFTYSFSGTLSNCASTYPGAPSGGTIYAGLHGLPTATGSGSCASSTTTGTSVINWSDGKTTVVQYSTTGVAAAVGLTGTVVQSALEGATTVTTNEPATPVGSSAGGVLAFQPPDPTQCAPGAAGVSSAGISGLIGTGNL